MGDLVSLPQSDDGSFSEAELRKIARSTYAAGKESHLSRFARRFGRPVEEIKRWHDEDNWIAARAAAMQGKEEKRLAEIAVLLKSANVKDLRQAALDTLKNCDDASNLVRGCLDRPKATGTTPDYLDKLLAAQERIEKLRKDAYARL